MITFENVKGLAGDNLQAVRLVLWLMGYRVVVLSLNSSNYHVPQSRPRVYIVGVLSTERGKFTFNGADDFENDRLQRAANGMAIGLRQEDAPLDKYLHSMHLPVMVMHALERKSQVPGKHCQKKWRQTHKEVFAKAGFDEIPPLHQIAARIVGEWPMPEREAQVLSYICYIA